uniref:Uncharacterized protein n=1 Tax=Oryza punctata TaxID=4537 RepID=A0A0E0MC00_ORYPU
MRTMAPWRLTVMASEQWTMAVEAKVLLRALLPDTGKVFTCAKSNNRQLLHICDIDRTSKVESAGDGGCLLFFSHRLYDMNKNVIPFFSCLLDDGWLLLRNVKLISIPRRYILP